MEGKNCFLPAPMDAGFPAIIYQGTRTGCLKMPTIIKGVYDSALAELPLKKIILNF